VKVKFEKKVDDQTFHSGRCAIITSGDRVIGTLGELHPTAAEAYGVKERIYLAELDLETMRECAEGEREYRPLPRFPAISRDLSLVCDEEISSGELIELISGAASCLEQVTLFDLYRGTGIPEGKKSVSYKLIFRRADRTMEAEEADRAVEKILKKLAERDVTLR
ncbi:MAG: phenylalanine--tRNA ligase subunit beta, partial [Eubacterium sp.]|nr:phenylalanine--tRNA ligase subunit beta [Eubacterium sp.]